MVLVPITSKNTDAKTVERYLPLLHKRCLPILKHLLIHGLIELDSVYTKINLKGTRPQNMPRSSKHRGRKKASIYSHRLRGLSNHKVCLATATDKNYNILVYSR